MIIFKLYLLYGLTERSDNSFSRLELSIIKGTTVKNMAIYLLYSIIAITAFAHATFIEFNFFKGFELWKERRDMFLKELKKVNHCFTETKTNEIMRVINSNQCSIVGLPLEDAIRLEYDNWLSEDWFPNEKELADMKLDEVM